MTTKNRPCVHPTHSTTAIASPSRRRPFRTDVASEPMSHLSNPVISSWLQILLEASSAGTPTESAAERPHGRTREAVDHRDWRSTRGRRLFRQNRTRQSCCLKDGPRSVTVCRPGKRQQDSPSKNSISRLTEFFAESPIAKRVHRKVASNRATISATALSKRPPIQKSFCRLNAHQCRDTTPEKSGCTLVPWNQRNP
jgi:hypothetical protein